MKRYENCLYKYKTLHLKYAKNYINLIILHNNLHKKKTKNVGLYFVCLYLINKFYCFFL